MQKINCQRSMEIIPAKGSVSHSPVFSLRSVMFTNTQVVELTWSGPEAAKKGCACVNETVSYFFPADVCQDGFVAPKGGVRASVLKSFYNKTSAPPTENLPSLKGTLSDIIEPTSMIPNEAWQNLKVLIAKDIYVCKLVCVPIIGWVVSYSMGVLRLNSMEHITKSFLEGVLLCFLGKRRRHNACQEETNDVYYQS